MSTHIAWATEVWNPVVGCTRFSDGCDKCYAFALHDRRYAAWKSGEWPAAPSQYHLPFSRVQLLPERLDEPLHWRKPRRVFVCSMSDLFHKDVDDQFIADVLWTAAVRAPSHTYQFLTKRPERMLEWFTAYASTGMPLIRGAANLWLGTSIENDRLVGRADYLRQTPAAVRFVSAEPLLGPLPSLDLTGIDWLIVGGESGPGARPMDPLWVDDLVERADREATAVFVKQASGLRPGQQGNLPDELWRRKEYPR